MRTHMFLLLVLRMNTKLTTKSKIENQLGELTIDTVILL